MYPPEAEQFKSFLVECREETRFYEFRCADRLMAIAVADRLQDGLSAIYTFFDPDEVQRSLGVQAVLWLIDEAKRLQLSYLFLGYWIKQCQKMNYKLEYRPIELFINGHWIPLD
jgi:arginine-tRNA-protein transferase